MKSSLVPYSALLVVPCPRCSSPAGVNCRKPDGSPVRREPRSAEEFGTHAARVHAWIREDKRKIRVVLRAEEKEDRDRAKRGLSRNMATLTYEQAMVILGGGK